MSLVRFLRGHVHVLACFWRFSPRHWTPQPALCIIHFRNFILFAAAFGFGGCKWLLLLLLLLSCCSLGHICSFLQCFFRLHKYERKEGEREPVATLLPSIRQQIPQIHKLSPLLDFPNGSITTSKTKGCGIMNTLHISLI